MDLLKSIAYPEEILALLRYKLHTRQSGDTAYRSLNLNKCYEYLSRTSRSFSAVIRSLHPELRDAVCIFYLVLRALDTVEDDVTIGAEEKMSLLKDFHNFLNDPDWNYTESKEKDRVVLENFPVISAEFRALRPEYRQVVSEICRRMGEGMIVYYLRSPGTIEQWNEYCHYVAGLVGIGLSNLFSASGLEDGKVALSTDLSNSMGLFLQKTNIIRDYLEDVEQGRHFWPTQVWTKYATNLSDLAQPAMNRKALSCLNELITNALSHVPDVLEYLSQIKDQTVFNFCAIPQVMAIATLERCYNNPRVFSGVVKIRKGETVQLMTQCTDIDSVRAIFTYFLSKIEDRIPSSDPSSMTSHQCVQVALVVSKSSRDYFQRSLQTPLCISAAILLLVVVFQYWTIIADCVQLRHS